jgi:Spy/CpxP family protein refolding chaperone
MKNYLRIMSIVLAASFFGAMANISSADPSSGWPHHEMMGGYGQGYGMGQGMMGGYGYGYGMGPGMMGGNGYGMGPGMMGMGNLRALNLNAEQKTKISQLRKEIRTKQWAVMGDMMDAQDKLQELLDADTQDAAAINKQYKAIEDLRRQMVENSVEAHNRINSILTKEQREKSREWEERSFGPMMHGW